MGDSINDILDQPMKFSIITPSFKRPDKLGRAIRSAIDQSHQDWEMLVIIDSPEDDGYEKLMSRLQDEHVRYLVNERNIGANKSRNKGLDHVSPQADRVIFLDDDDYLAPEALGQIATLISGHPDEKWLVTNRAEADGSARTRATKSDSHYLYARDYLIGRRLKGDATHAIDARLAASARFPTLIKNGEEWLYFFQLGRRSPLYYVDTDTTLTDGYEATGLNYRDRGLKDQLRSISHFMTEGYRSRIIYSPYFWIYTALRSIRAFIK